LSALAWKSSDCSVKNVISLLNEVELREIESSPASVVRGPRIEVALVREIVIDQAREHPDHKRVAVAVGLEIVLHQVCRAKDAAATNELFGVRRT
jgi:hypothetical protein